MVYFCIMKNFKSKNWDEVEYEFYWFCGKGEFLQADGDNIMVDEFTVRPIDKGIKGTYTFQALEIDAEIKILSQTRDEGDCVKGMGICEAMLPELFGYYKKNIISSSKRVSKIPGESRVKKMTDIYEKLVTKGLVQYDEKRDVYVYPNPISL
ncbi:hypothetical protein SAMN05216490_4939 [Mucilaginibacter mallensis]|uniref:Uncharacterized protein n=2 Tax=Mucilaginibacter mallensis TaxID=652787 RepID=A0A1H2CE50_MUCMA|nr:hypothetical protein SAMN05216490_4939 [Mucilaginibacter mallensis]